MTTRDWLTLLIAHHYPEDYDRCTFVFGRPVCRRCLFLYGPTLIVIGLQYTRFAMPETWDPLLTGLAVPATLEFILERLGKLHYHPSRVVATSLLLSVPLGRAFWHYFQDPGDPRGWGFVLVFGIPALSAALYRAWLDLRRFHRAQADGSLDQAAEQEGHRPELAQAKTPAEEAKPGAD